MGKKSKRPNGNKSNNINNQPAQSQSPPQVPQPEPTNTNIAYPQSDGPSEEDLSCTQTDSPTLQKKLDQLTLFAKQNNRQNFVSQFVPLDLTNEDRDAFLNDLTNAPEAEGQWNNLIDEIEALALGKGVSRIEGDQKSKAIFYFEHPTLKGCDREVSFVCVGGEWRAEG
jgi:hypothetical protein